MNIRNMTLLAEAFEQGTLPVPFNMEHFVQVHQAPVFGGCPGAKPPMGPFLVSEVQTACIAGQAWLMFGAPGQCGADPAEKYLPRDVQDQAVALLDLTPDQSSKLFFNVASYIPGYRPVSWYAITAEQAAAAIRRMIATEECK